METTFDNIAEANTIIARQRVMADLKLLTRDTEALLRATAHDLSDQAREARTRVTATLERAKATCLALQAQASSAAKAAARKTDILIREHPYESLGVAFGVGLLIGVLALKCHRHGHE